VLVPLRVGAPETAAVLTDLLAELLPAETAA
jgi:hypothetical protein